MAWKASDPGIRRDDDNAIVVPDLIRDRCRQSTAISP